MQLTHKFQLSGVETEVTRLSGTQQGILTKNKKAPMSERLLEMLPTVVLRVGDVVIESLTESEKATFFKGMLSCHIKQILTEVRSFTYGDDEFVFTFDFEKDVKDADGKFMRKQKISEEMVLPLDGGFPVKPVKKLEPDVIASCKTLKQLRAIAPQLKELICTDYHEVVDNSIIEFVAPVTGRRTQMTMRNGLSGQIIGTIKTEELDSNAALFATNPKWHDGTNWITYQIRDLKKADAQDLEYMRMILKLYEGRVDTELEFTHPNPDENGKVEHTDLLEQLAFFFPSEGI